MASSYRNRQVQINQVVFDQVGIFQSDFFNKVTGLQHSDVTFQLYLNNQVVSWPLVDGSTVSDGQVAAGQVFWNELPSGSYGIRFFPTQMGHWSLSVSFAPSPSQIVNIDFDIVNFPSATSADGLRTNFC